MRTVVLDPGHGGTDPGACGHLCGREADVNLAVALALLDALEEVGFRVVLTRASDTYLGLGRRAAIANAERADLLVSIHCNAATTPEAAGFEVWTSPGTTRADRAATCIWEAFREVFPYRRGRIDLVDGDLDKEAPFVVLVRTACPAVLVELAFVSHPEEDALLASAEGRHSMVAALSLGICRWFDELDRAAALAGRA